MMNADVHNSRFNGREYLPRGGDAGKAAWRFHVFSPSADSATGANVREIAHVTMQKLLTFETSQPVIRGITL